jgi:hypothetical protein
MQMESDCVASDPVGAPLPVIGTFNTTTTWITKNVVQIPYVNMTACNLTLNGSVIGTISGNGTFVYNLTAAAGAATLVCGTASLNVTVIAYTPAFKATSFTGNTTSGATVNFTTDGLAQQISFTNFTATTTASSLTIYPPAGTTQVTLTTIGTNPILTATTSAIITAVDSRSWKIATQPTAVQQNGTAVVVVQEQYFATIQAAVYTTNGTLSRNLTAWTNAGTLATS